MLQPYPFINGSSAFI